MITYLLLREDAEQGSISEWGFYIHRTLRIWPLYYLTVIVGFLLNPLLVSAQNLFIGFPALQNPPMAFQFSGIW